MVYHMISTRYWEEKQKLLWRRGHSESPRQNVEDSNSSRSLTWRWYLAIMCWWVLGSGLTFLMELHTPRTRVVYPATWGVKYTRDVDVPVSPRSMPDYCPPELSLKLTATPFTYTKDLKSESWACSTFDIPEKWPDPSYSWVIPEGVPLRTTQVVYGTFYAQQKIWTTQYPGDCSGKRFAILNYYNSGIGSQIHVYGALLAVAMDLGRIAVWDSWIDPWLEGSYCKDWTSFGCFFHRLTNCTYPSKAEMKNAKAEESDDRVIRVNMGMIKSQYPKIFTELLECAPVVSKKYWWRQQAAAFMVRPNQRTIGMMDYYEQKVRSAKGYGIPKCPTASMHIRHGDKNKEMELFGLEEYEEKLHFLRQNNEFLSTFPPLAIFLSTEDNGVITEAET